MSDLEEPSIAGSKETAKRTGRMPRTGRDCLDGLEYRQPRYAVLITQW